MDLGVGCLDTARLYGESEARIGAWLNRRQPDQPKPAIITKLAGIPDGVDAGAFVRDGFAASLDALGVDRVAGYLLHRAGDMARPGVAEALAGLVANGQAGGFGVSVYHSEEIEAALAVPGLSLIQAPVNLFDRRLVQSGVLAECRRRNMAVHARSVFLQGLFTLPPESLPPFFAPARPALVKLRSLAAACGLRLETLALKAVAQTPGVTAVVVGADTAEQLAANVAASAAPDLPASVLAEAEAACAGLPVEILEPSRWPKRAPGDKR
jgi:aryl-alcohol dehydrogenase-like predicted oxidoreductase